MKKSFFISLTGIFLFLMIFTGCGGNKQVIRMQKLEEGVSSPVTVDELKDAISKYEDRVKDIQLAQSQIGIWYKILGTRYIDNKMYGLALDCFKKALEFYPENQNLHYYVGVCAGYMARTGYDYEGKGSSQRLNFLKTSEQAYLNAIQLESRYARALYGLSVLYVYGSEPGENGLNEPEKAIPYLKRYLDIETKDTDGMFLLARAYYAIMNYEEAEAMYDRIISVTKSSERKNLAENLKKTVQNAANGL